MQWGRLLTEKELNQQDFDWLNERGLNSSAIKKQILLLTKILYYPKIQAPIQIGDGVFKPDQRDEQVYLDKALQVDDQAKIKFIPASGAASRMFQDLLSILTYAESGSMENPTWLAFFLDLKKMPFFSLIPPELVKFDKLTIPTSQRILQYILLKEGLGYYYMPKAFIPFHVYSAGDIRTAFEEHIRESLMLYDSKAFFHFTFSPEHRSLVEEQSRGILDMIKSQTSLQIDVGITFQSSLTQTIALTSEGRILRDLQNKPVLRAGGHGALLDNLNGINSQFIMIKNVDNIPYSDYWPERNRFQRILVGLASEIHQQIKKIRSLLNDGLAAQATSIKKHLQDKYSLFKGEPENVFDSLDRPLRIVSVIENQGEPGGGIFWVRDGQNTFLQILEHAQISPEQKTLFLSSRYFNPVDMVVCPLNSYDQKIDLHIYRDDRQYLISHRPYRDQTIRILEYPGLWNGSMAYYNTVCVETPPGLFSPVKTIFDLLKPGHQPQVKADYFHGGNNG